ncbi:chemotaxis protein CheB [Ramlibacter sp. MMS24-I3-19]|uniref:chemotaxis protein CheB n=1 Tax=Ramlibacter sp. MMS24-I3-19 TaxID=3416606 RepID=UPI003D056BCD
MPDSHVVVLGASLGGVGALMRIAALLPPHLSAIVAVTLHIGAQHSVLPESLSRRGPARAVHPRQGERPKPGTIYVAPPVHHMLLEPDGIRLSRGARENHVRPAIDPMFRSAAIGWGSRQPAGSASGWRWRWRWRAAWSNCTAAGSVQPRPALATAAA